ncbi:pilus (MSHA type) biogenesis protein MshL [Noviherbaspirillum saxi]|uniref:Pilus (MSHA type) biogenesis protein MshL n=2 Tax=Noviherbaspirillum saxi TaxID=2320863 RepID=A0A3A3FXG2_9BURK|nr:pilus (MSHA type) biogenesis protein MshL [Noviherbaspirillum saxi]RJG00065.1 pilus (MSHA type) biogenesis protein MshL [Noviherbaspirillum saxi]
MVRYSVHKITSAIVILGLAGCTSAPPRHDTFNLINAELSKASARPTTQVAQPDAVAAALLPPIQIEVPRPRQPLEERFGVTFNNVPAAQFFMGIVSGTQYSMLVHPDVSGNISVNLKDVTVLEALDAIRELYGYDYKIEGNRIYVKPLTLQTKVFQVNYLTGSRKGTSDIRVTSGSVSDTSSSGPGAGTGNNAGTPSLPGQPPGVISTTLNSSKISTSSTNDFWSELRQSLEAIVGNKEGRSVVISPQSGVVLVRAMWDELRNVSAYLKATQLAVDRQVIIDAKILEVELSDGFQSGINWASFASLNASSNSRASLGMVSPGATLSPRPRDGSASAPLTGGNANSVIGIPGFTLAAPSGAAGSLFGLAFQTSNFAALISFLETQGHVHVLSSPRIATLNNQKAVLKVGRDEFFVTNVSTTTTAVGTSSTTSPTVTVQPFFSGVALDVTPQIDENGNITLHIHPSVSNVTTVDKPLNLGAAGSFSLPLASSTISETDSVVRGQDGQIVAIGGLMRQSTASDRSQLPGAGNAPGIGALFRNTNQSTQKRELVILLKPTIVQGSATWAQDVMDTQQRVQGMAPRSPVSQ